MSATAVLLDEQCVAADYAEVADPDTLTPLESVRGRAALLVAARLGSARLIDNMQFL